MCIFCDNLCNLCLALPSNLLTSFHFLSAETLREWRASISKLFTKEICIISVETFCLFIKQIILHIPLLFVSVVYHRFWIAFFSYIPCPFMSCYVVSLKWLVLPLHSVCAEALNSLSASLGYFLPFVTDMWTPTSLETRLFIFVHIYKDAWIYSPSSSRSPLANSYFQVESRSVSQMSCSLPLLSQDCLWLKTREGEENRTQPCSETSLGRGPRQWVAPSKKAAGEDAWKCHSLLYPCKYIKTFDSKPSSWITELTFFYLIFQLELCIFTDGLRMTVPFCSSVYSFVPRQNENKFLQMFLQNQCCIRTSLLISTTLVWWGRGRQLRFKSLLCSSQGTIFYLMSPSCVSQWVFHSPTKESFVQFCKANCKPETA